MKNVLKVNHVDRTIVMDRTFAKYAENTMSPEYAHLQQVRLHYESCFLQRFCRTPDFCAFLNTWSSLIPSRYRCVIATLSCPIRRDRLYRSSPFFS